MSDFVLASGSPRRALLLSAAGYTFSVDPADIDETQRDGERPSEMVLRLSHEKASTVLARRSGVVLAADTIVVRDDAILGKPRSSEDAVDILTSLVGRSHLVLTGWSALDGSAERFGIAESVVTFANRSRDELDEYVERVQPLDKAGAYALQGDDGWLVQKVTGSKANVMGLPLGEIAPALADLGIERSTPDRD
ncbi:MAG: Maf family protein [Acidimicrobiia bacterium]